MRLKKLNAAVGLLASVTLLDHCLFMSIYMIMNGQMSMTSVPAYLTLGLAAVHIIISMYIMMFEHDGWADSHDRYQWQTRVQRLSGIVVVVLLLAHMIIALQMQLNGDGDLPKRLFCLLQILLSALTLCHVSISVPRGLITIGVLKSEKSHRIAQTVSLCVSAPVLVLNVVGFMIHLL